jgi:UDP-glucose 4-epimerase
MRIIIPGASGFIGKNFILKAPRNWEIIAIYNKSNLQDFVEEHGLNNIITVKCDLTNEKEVEKLSKQIGNKFDICLYLAANTSIPLSVKDPIFDFHANTISVLNFLNFFRGKKIIFLSSGAVYDGLSGLVNPSMSVSPNIPYAISKLASENYIKFYVAKKGTFKNYIILRFFGAYGPYEPARKIYTKLVKTFYFDNKNEFTIYGDGTNLIDAMYIDDTIDGILKVIKSDNQNITVDFCSGTPLTIDEMVYASADIFSKKDVTVRHEGITQEYIDFYVSNKMMEKLFGFKPTTPLNEGLWKLAEHLEGCSNER